MAWTARPRDARSTFVFFGHVLVGAVLGVVLLHPVTMAIYWFEFHDGHASIPAVITFVSERLERAFTLPMLPMTGAFLAIGGGIGAGSALYTRLLMRQSRLVGQLSAELDRTLASLLNAGEGEQVEFKASARWDARVSRVNKDLELAIAKTIAAFFNHRGGTLLIGITDRGDACGLAEDYASLPGADRNAFERFVVGLVRARMGGDLAMLLHVVFHSFEGHEVCRVLVEPSPRPVYVRDGNATRYYVRTGNASTELDARDTVAHVNRRWRTP